MGKACVLVLIHVSAVILWFALPLLLGIVHGFVQDRWVLQDTSREWAYVGIAAAVLFLAIVAEIRWSKWDDFSWKVIGVCALWSLLGGWYGGPIVLNLRNHSSTASGQAVQFKTVDQLRGLVEIRAVGEAYDGITFKYSTSLWRKRGAWETGTVSGFVYRGKLGLCWAELPEK